jgi:hypothetical protein
MRVSRRQALKALSMGGLQLVFPVLGHPSVSLKAHSKGNPVIPNLGACDPQVRVYDDHVYLYSTHDADPNNQDFVMNDWWVWHTTNLIDWEMVSVLKPEQTYFKKPSTQCWATDAARRNGKYFFYFSMGPEEVGVMVGSSPSGPWRDPLGHPLVAKGSVKTEARDPGILQEADGTSYIVFGTFDYYIARLNEDMVSLAEEPRLIQIANPEGPYGKGHTDDKPFLHRRENKYYLSWGCYYGMSDSPYGPYECRGSIIHADRLAPEFGDVSKWKGPQLFPAQDAPKDWLGFDRHGSFFELFGQWYFICNDQALPGTSPVFRNSVLCYVRYKENGEIDPVRITAIGVGQYDAHVGMDATDFFKTSDGIVSESPEGTFEVRGLKNNSYLIFPNIRNLRQKAQVSVVGRPIHPEGIEIEIRRGDLNGARLGSTKIVSQASGKESEFKIQLHDVKNADDLCLVFRGGQGELLRLRHLSFA